MVFEEIIESNDIEGLENWLSLSPTQKELNDALLLAVQNGYKEIVELLVAKGAEIDSKNRVNNTALHLAAYENHKEIVELLLEKGAKIDSINRDKWTALHLAAKNGHKEIVELLIIREVDIINAEADNNWTALHLAAYEGHKEIVELLLEKDAKIDVKNSDNYTVLHLAAYEGHKEIVELLLEKGAKIDSINLGTWTALHLAAKNGHKEIVKLLLEKGAKIDAINRDKWTTLHLAAENDHKEVVELLLEKGAKIDAINRGNWSALHLAAKNGHKEIVELLLEKGAKIDVKNSDNCTVLHLAAQNGHKEIVELLIAREANIINAETDDNWTALHLAAQNGHKEIVELLIARKANIINAETDDNWTALHLAAQNGHKEIVELLLEKGAKIDAKNSDNCTALHLAADNGREEIVELLISEGANINAIAGDNCTALYVAAYNGHKEIVELLLEKGAKIDVKNSNNCSVLYIAAKKNHNNVVKFLISKGADVKAEDSEGKTALEVTNNADIRVHLTKAAIFDALLNNKVTVLSRDIISFQAYLRDLDNLEIIKARFINLIKNGKISADISLDFSIATAAGNLAYILKTELVEAQTEAKKNLDSFKELAGIDVSELTKSDIGKFKYLFNSKKIALPVKNIAFNKNLLSETTGLNKNTLLDYAKELQLNETHNDEMQYLAFILKLVNTPLSAAAEYLYDTKEANILYALNIAFGILSSSTSDSEGVKQATEYLKDHNITDFYAFRKFATNVIIENLYILDELSNIKLDEEDYLFELVENAKHLIAYIKSQYNRDLEEQGSAIEYAAEIFERAEADSAASNDVERPAASDERELPPSNASEAGTGSEFSIDLEGLGLIPTRIFNTGAAAGCSALTGGSVGFAIAVEEDASLVGQELHSFYD